MKPAPKRHRMPDPIGLSDSDSLTKRQDEALEIVIEPEDDGLAAWFLRVAPGATAHAPHPNQGGGQYVIVAGGNVIQADNALPCLSCLYVPADEEPLALQASSQGLEVLIMQFPTAEAYAPV
jgi:hypothetical protein